MKARGQAYRIRHWERKFENAATRKLRFLHWVPFPTALDDKGLGRLRQEKACGELYAAWVLVVQVAAKLPARGVLADEDGPLDAEDLGAKTGFPAELFAQAFLLFTEPRIGWLELVDWPEAVAESANASADPPEASGEGANGSGRPPAALALNGTEPNSTEQNNRSDPRVRAGEEDRVRATLGAQASRFVSSWSFEFAAGLCLTGPDLDRNRKPLRAVARKCLRTPDPEGMAQRLLALAKEKATAGLDQPVRAWQAEVNRIFPS